MASKTMNNRTVKRVKDPKGCSGCPECVQEPNGFGRPVTYRCRIRPIEAGKDLCDKSPIKEKGSPPYQVFLRVPKDGMAIPEIVLMTEGMFKEKGVIHYPADHVLLDGVTVQDWDGWHIAQAIHDAVKDRQDTVRQDEIGQAVLDACNMLHDVCTLNESLSSKSAVELVTGAKRILEQIAGRLQLPLDYE